MKRGELYALVWQNPTVHLAKRFGVSNARLRKICKDYEIPLPPAGYWTKLAHGKTVERPELPQATPSIFSRINSALRRMGEIPLRLADAQIDEFDLKFPSNVIDHERTAHRELLPKAAELDQSLRRTSVEESGFVTLSMPKMPAIRVGPESIERVVLLFDAFLGALLARGFKVVEEHETFHIGVDDELFDLKIYETIDRRLNESARQSGKETSSEGGRVSFRPSGKLCMEIVDSRQFRWSNRNLVGQWHDRRGALLEESLPSAIMALAAAAKLVKHCRTLAQLQRENEDRDLARLRGEAARSDRARRMDQYLREKAADYAKYLELVRFAEFMLTLKAPDSDSPSAHLCRKLQRLVADIRQSFTPQVLDAEIARLNLLADDDLD